MVQVKIDSNIAEDLLKESNHVLPSNKAEQKSIKKLLKVVNEEQGYNTDNLKPNKGKFRFNTSESAFDN